MSSLSLHGRVKCGETRLLVAGGWWRQVPNIISDYQWSIISNKCTVCVSQPSPALPQIRAHSKYSSVSLCLCAGLHSARGRNCSSRTFNTRGGAAMTRSGWCGSEKWHNSLYPYCLSFSLVLLILRAKRDSKLPEFYPCPMFQTKKESLFDTPSMTRAGAGPCDSPKQGLTSKRAIWL